MFLPLPYARQIELRSWIASIFIIAFSSPVVLAQCNGSISLGNDTTLCDGQTIILSPGPGYLSYLWEDGSTTPTHTASATGTYSCVVQQLEPGSNLVINGNFSAGVSGFTSGYMPGTGGTWGTLSLEGTYAVASNSGSTHSNFAACTDHTGGGNMLVVNGAAAQGVSVWCQTVSVQPGTSYAFSAWLMSVVSENPANLQFTINGQVLGSPFIALPTTCTWEQFYSIWNSGSNTTAEICITNQNTLVSGNDFALDDIAMSPFCTYTDTIQVNVVDYPDPNIGPDQVVCGATSVVLDATYPGATHYLWNNGSTDPVLEVNANGTYWVHVFTAACMGRDSISISLYPEPTVDLGPDRTICTGGTVELDASFPGASYLWHDGSTAPTWSGSASADVSVEVAVGPCFVTDVVQVVVEDCGVEIVLPNVFSPNGDGFNSVFTPIIVKGVRSLSIEVYNRWGQLMFTSAALNFTWSGRSGSAGTVPEGTYFWTLTYAGNAGESGEQHGTLTLLR